MSNPYAPPDPDRPPPERRRPSEVTERPTESGPPGQPRPPNGPKRPEEPSHTPEQATEMLSAVRWFGLVMVLVLLTSSLSFPWQLLAPVAGVVAIIVGVRAIRVARRVRWKGMLVPLLVGGIALTTLMALSAGATLTMWDLEQERAQCHQRAVTLAASERCDREFEQARDARLEQLGSNPQTD